MDRGRAMAMIRMGRLPLLFGGLLLYLLGAFTAAASGHPLSLIRLFLGYVVLGPAHLSVHYSNDYFDADGDLLGKPTGVSGGSGVLARYPDLRPLARLTALSLIGISCVAGVFAYLTVLPTPFILLLLVVGNGLGWFYSAPPVRLSSRGLGEVSTALTFGLLLPGMGYLAIAGGLDLFFLPVSLPLVLLGATFILTVEIPDREADALSGKVTSIVKHGISAGLRIGFISAVLAAAFFFLAALTGIFPSAAASGILAVASFIPLASPLAANIRMPRDGEGMVRYAQRTVSSLILFAAVVDAGLLLVLLKP
ncbi:MAG: prenyltransferase [Methanomicrobiales archaeon]|nr:prenyltransferase [Methanomicrobiales archaeon]